MAAAQAAAEDRTHLHGAVASLAQYALFANAEADRRKAALARLSEQDAKLLPLEALRARIASLRNAATTNQALFDAAITHAGLDHIAALAVGVEPADSDTAATSEQAASGSWLPPSYSSTAGPKLRVAPPHHVDKARRALHQLYREWSAEAADEREACFGPLLSSLERLLPARPAQRGTGLTSRSTDSPAMPPESADARAPAPTPSHSAAKGDADGISPPELPPLDSPRRPRVLVAGAGMGRLLLELAVRGYRAIGCEFSYQMLLLGDFMLNGSETHALVPWAEEANNQVKGKQQLRQVRVPDARASDAAAVAARAGWELDMGMAAGEFAEVFGAADQRGAFDAILMPFFLDTAVVPSEYLMACANALKPGGVLVSLGPLQYHWNPGAPLRIAAGSAGDAESDAASAPGGDRWTRSVELTWEEMMFTVRAAGFTVLEERRIARLPYSHDPASLRRHEYDGMLLVAQLAPG